MRSQQVLFTLCLLTLTAIPAVAQQPGQVEIITPGKGKPDKGTPDKGVADKGKAQPAKPEPPVLKPIAIPEKELRELAQLEQTAARARQIFQGAFELFIDKGSPCTQQVLALLEREAQLRETEYAFVESQTARLVGAPYGWRADLKARAFNPPNQGVAATP